MCIGGRPGIHHGGTEYTEKKSSRTHSSFPRCPPCLRGESAAFAVAELGYACSEAYNREYRAFYTSIIRRCPVDLFVIVPVVIVVLYVLNSIKILAEYERGVIFRLGRLLGTAKGPGVILVFAPIDRIVRVSLRQEALEVPPQDIITRDNVTLKVNAVIFLRVIDPNKAVVAVTNYMYQTSQFAQTTLRSVLGEVDLDELLAHREKINLRLQSILDQHTDPWGVKVTNVEVKQVDLPETMTRAMAKQAEAEREKRSKIIHAEGEFAAAQRLTEAAHLLSTEPTSIQLRYLQTLTEIGVEKNTTIIFPVPVDLLAGLQKLVQRDVDKAE